MAVFPIEVPSCDSKGFFIEICSLCFGERTTSILILWQCARPAQVVSGCTPSSPFSLFSEDGSEAGHVEHGRSRHVLAFLPSEIGCSCTFMHTVTVARNHAHAWTKSKRRWSVDDIARGA